MHLCVWHHHNAEPEMVENMQLRKLGILANCLGVFEAQAR